MKEILIGTNEAGQRFDKFLSKYMRKAPKSFFYKMLRKKNITLNGKKATGQEILSKGDQVKLFLSDETIENFSDYSMIKKSHSKAHNAVLDNKVKLDILYENDDVLFLNKPVGMLSQKAKSSDITLNEYFIQYLLDTDSITEEQLQTFRPSACNRLDRNTSGIVACGKTLKALQILSEMFRTRSLEKYYLCLVKGCVNQKKKIDGYLLKNEKKNKVMIIDEATYNSIEDPSQIHRIQTEYDPICSSNDVTLLKVHLITGKTHQIRAHLASEGHPIIGDPKYGDIELNKKMQKQFGLRHQLLHARILRFPKMEGDKYHPIEQELSEKEIIATLPDLFVKICNSKGVLKNGNMEL